MRDGRSRLQRGEGTRTSCHLSSGLEKKSLKFCRTSISSAETGFVRTPVCPNGAVKVRINGLGNLRTIPDPELRVLFVLSAASGDPEDLRLLLTSGGRRPSNISVSASCFWSFRKFLLLYSPVTALYQALFFRTSKSTIPKSSNMENSQESLQRSRVN